MTVREKIDFMIQSLQIAKEELEFAELYMKTQKNDDNFYTHGHLGYGSRMPNGTLVRENLRQVGRMANMVANEVVLSPYSGYKIYK